MLPGKQYSPEDVLAILRKRVWFLLVPLSLAAAGTAVWSRTLPDLYYSQATIQIVPQTISESLVRSTIEARIEDRLPAIQQAIQSRTRLEAMIEEFDLYPEERRTMLMEDVVDMMRGSIDTWIVRRDAFGVSFVGTDPVKVARVTERLGNFFIEQSLSYRHNLTEVTDEFLDSQLEETRRELEAQERRLEAYRRAYAGQLPNQSDANLQQMGNANLQIQRISDSINQALNRRLVLEQQLRDLQRATPQNAGAMLVDGQPANSAAQDVLAAQAAVEALRARGLRPGHPDLDAALRTQRDAEARYTAQGGSNDALPPGEAARQAQLESLTAQIAEIDRQVAAARLDEQRARTMADQAQTRLDSMPTRETEMVALTRDYDIIADKYRNLLQKREDARISANLERRQVGEQFNVIDPARVAERPFSPNRQRMNLVGAIVGLVAGLVLSAGLEYRDRGLRTDEDVRSVVGLPVLAVVPIMRSEADRRRRFWGRILANLGFGAVVAVSLTVCAYIYLSS